MSIVNVGVESEFDGQVEKGVVLVDFFTHWCGPCKRMEPVLEEVAKKNPGVSIVKVDVEAVPDLASRFGVRSVPTFILFKDGKLVNNWKGTQLEEVLSAAIKAG